MQSLVLQLHSTMKQVQLLMLLTMIYHCCLVDALDLSLLTMAWKMCRY